jgi:hypothetical protein
MKKTFKICLLTLLVLSVFQINSCKKYEEDDYWITFRKPVKRILGNYHLKELILNNINYTDSIAELWGTNTVFEFSDIHYYYLTHDRPELNKGPKALILRFDSDFLNQNNSLPPIYRGTYSVPGKNKLWITLPNPHDLSNIDIKPIGFEHSFFYHYFIREDYSRSIDWQYDIIKIDDTGLIFTNGVEDRIVFERIE